MNTSTGTSSAGSSLRRFRSQRLQRPACGLAGFAALGLGLAMPSVLQAQTSVTWDGSDSTLWSDGVNWVGGIAPTSSLTANIADFSSAFTNQPDVGTTSIAGLTFSNSSAVTLSGTSLTIGKSGITVNSGASAVTVSAPITLGAAQTWTNNSSNTLNVGSIAPTPGSGTSVKLAGTGSFATSNTDTNGMLGGWAVISTGASTLGWAHNNGTTVSAATTSALGTSFSGNNSTVNWINSDGNTTLTGATQVNSFISNNDVTISGLLTIGSGGMILGNNASKWIKNGTGGQITSGAASGELFVYTPNTAATDMQLQVAIVNNGGTAVKLVKSDPGYLKLTGANTYTGGTIVNGGTLVAGSVSALSSGAVQVNSGALLTLDTTNNTTINGNFSGAGTVTFQNTSGNNFSYTVGGDWSGFTGTLNYNSSTKTANLFAPASMDLSNATVVFASSNGNSSFRTSATGTTKFGSLAGFGALWATGATEIGNLGTDTTFSGVISQAGSITKVGNGTLTLSGQNTYTGGTTINAGTLALGHATNSLANTGAVTVNGGTLSLGANSDTVGAVTLQSGSITGSTGVLTGSSYAVQSGTVSAILGGTGALTKTTSGTVTLSGANSYTGATTVSQGVLSVTGSLASGSAVNVASGATLRGTGTIGGATTIASGGSLAAGVDASTLGTLTFGSSLDTTGATVFLKLNSTTGTADLFAANGLTLGNATLSVSDLGSGTWTGSSTFTIFDNTSAGSVAGTFAGFAEGSSITVGSNIFTISYLGGTGNDISLSVSAIPEPSTYAAIVGALALAGVVWQRRRRAA